MAEAIDWNQPVFREGVTFIEASAGTGKTFTIEGLVLRLLLDGGLAPSNILLVTFTKAAVASLSRRLRERLQGACAELESGRVADPALAPWADAEASSLAESARKLRRALQTIDEANVTTIHGFCQRLLSEAALASGGLSEFEVAPDPSAARLQRIEDFRRRHFHEGLPWLATVLQSRGSWRKELGRLDDLALFHRSIALLDTPEAKAELSEAERNVEAAFHVMQKGWQADDGAVAKLLRDHPALSNDKKKWQGSREATIERFEVLLSASMPPEQVLSLAPLFSSKGLEELVPPSRRKHWDGTPFAALVDAFVEAVDAGVAAVRQCFYEEAIAAQGRDLLTRPVRTFNELLSGARQVLEGATGERVRTQTRQRLQAVLIDEFQDTDPLQWEIFERLFAEPPSQLYLVGDPKQAIYSFRGADIFAYLQARAAANRTLSLGTNYRSTPQLIAAVNALFSASGHPFVFPAITFEPASAPPESDGRTKEHEGRWLPALEVNLYGHDLAKPASVSAAEAAVLRGVTADLLAFLEEQSEATPEQFAVLTRTNRQAQAAAGALRAQGLPVRLQSGINVLNTDEAQWLFTLMHAVLHPVDTESLRAALVQPLFDWNAQRIGELDTNTKASLEIERHRQQWQQNWTRTGMPGLLSSLERTDGCLSRLLTREDGAASLARLQRLGEVIRLAESELHLTPGGSLRWYGTALQTDLESDEERYLLTTSSESGGVEVMTAHQSKGLQFDYVFCPFFWRGPRTVDEPLAAHLDDESGQRCVSLAPRKRVDERLQAAALREAISEECRLLYVALTRAKQRCWAYWANVRDDGDSPWGRLLPEGADIEHWLNPIAEAQPETVAVRPRAMEEDAPSPVFSNEEAVSRNHEARRFRSRIAAVAATSSFSSLAAQSSPHEADHDSVILPVETEASEDRGPDFPAGIRTGRLFHEVFERVDFTDTSEHEPVIAERLRTHGFLPVDEWLGPALRLVTASLEHPLPQIGPGFTLRHLTRAMRREEVEFALPVAWTDGTRLVSRLQALGLLHQSDTDRARVAAVRGVLRGFIDLLFVYQKKYYILDWKTNLLGGYGAATISRAMDQAAYRLQANLYTLALQQALGGAGQVGGACYLFVRGAGESSGQAAVHFEAPDPDLLRELATALGLPTPR